MTKSMNSFIRASRGRTATSLGDVNMNSWIRQQANVGSYGLAQANADPATKESAVDAAPKIPAGNAGSGTGELPPDIESFGQKMNNFIRLSSGRNFR